MVPQWFLFINICYLSEKGYQKHTMIDVVVWLSCYAYIFTICSYVTVVNQCLTIFNFKNFNVIGKTSVARGEKTHKNVEKVEETKIPTVNPLF